MNFDETIPIRELDAEIQRPRLRGCKPGSTHADRFGRQGGPKV